MNRLVWIVLVGACVHPVPVPSVAGDPGTVGFQPPCCSITDGPWHVVLGTVDGAGSVTWGTSDIGRLWAYDPADPGGNLDGDDNTIDWYEYAERKDSVWRWPKPFVSSNDPGYAWRVYVNPIGDPAINCLVTGYQKCQEFQAYNTWVPHPNTELLTGRPLTSKRILLPSEYHAEGKYKVTATFDGAPPTTKVGWFITKDTGNGVHQEVFCLPSGWSWPKRASTGSPKVTWDIQYDSAAPASLPTDATTCGNLPDGTATQALRSDSVKLN